MRRWSCGGQNLMQTRENFCEVFALKFASFATKLFGVICRSCKYFYHFPPHQNLWWFADMRE